MKKLLLFAAAALMLAACGNENEGGPLTVGSIEVNPAKCTADTPVHFSVEVSGGKTPYTFKWVAVANKQTAFEEDRQEFDYTFPVNGSYKITLTVTDAAGASFEKKKNIVVDPAIVEEKGELKLVWNGYMTGYNSISSAAVDNSGNVYATTRDLKLYKFNSDGTKAWEKPIVSKPADQSVTMVTPTIDSDGTVYAGGGSKGGDGVYVAFNPDGSEKWRFKDFFAAEGLALAPNIEATMAGIDSKNVYVGNVGTSGSVLSINKADGTRVNFCKHGTGGPVGGARTGIVISKAGTIHWYGGVYGLFGADKAAFDTKGQGTDFGWRIFGESGAPDFAKTAPYCALALASVNGKPHVCGMATDATGTKIYAADCQTGALTCNCYVEDTDDQDQGGVVVTSDGYLVASLNYTLGHDNGGIVMVDPKTSSIVARYSVQEKVSGAAAVDNNGNVHFGTEAGYYYIVRRNGSNFELLVKRNLAEVVKADSRYSEQYKELYSAKIWSSVVIGDDGKMYICYTDDETRAFGGVAVLSYEGCKGPQASSDWPMMGRDRRHTNNQN